MATKLKNKVNPFKLQVHQNNKYLLKRKNKRAQIHIERAQINIQNLKDPSLNR